MESIIAKALEYTLKYWLKSFSRDQFKLQGRTAQLSNLDINGDALHASLGLPPAINVTTAKVGKLEIILPYVSNVQVEPIVVQIDRLDLVLEESDDVDASRSTSGPPSTISAKGSGYGFADKIADGMTLEIGIVNLLLETHGGSRRRAGATWASPMASITIRNLQLYTTNERWQVVNLKEARDFSNNKKFIYVFKKLEWENLSIDLLPHPDMFSDPQFGCSESRCNRKDEDGANRVFFGGERFIEGISGEACITIQRTELNSPLGLEVQLHIMEVVCPALSEPGLRALLRFLTGFYVCLNRDDINPNSSENSTETAGRSLVSMVVDHIFLRIKDVEFQLELLMQSLFFSRTSVSDGEMTKYLTRFMIGGVFLRDTFPRPPCTLVQPMMQNTSEDVTSIPDFAKDFCPPIYPHGDHQHWQISNGVPLISMHSLQLQPSPTPPILASQTVIECQPLMIHLLEESCLRIASFLADGVVVNPGAVLPDSSINTLAFTLTRLDVTVPLDMGKSNDGAVDNTSFKSSVAGARLHVENLFFYESPSLKLKLLNLEKDPACFSLWEDQPVDASQKKSMAGASLIIISLETCNETTKVRNSLWKCAELDGICFEVAMATADGSPLTTIPPPGGLVRIGASVQQYLSNASVEELFFVLDLYAYFGNVSDKITVIGENNSPKEFGDESSVSSLMEKAPGDTAVSLSVRDIQLKFLENTSSDDSQGVPLVLFAGESLFVKVTHRTLGGAMAISSTLRWDSIVVDCADTGSNLLQENSSVLASTENGHLMGNGYPQLRSVMWVHNRKISSNVNAATFPFLDVNWVQVIPYDAQDSGCHSLRVSACISGLRLGGGMNYAEALLHRFGILGPDGGPGKGLTKGLEQLSAGPLSKLFKSSPMVVDEHKESMKNGSSEDRKDSHLLQLGAPDDVDVLIELKDWLFALEGEEEMAERWWLGMPEDSGREERCWHATFRSIRAQTKSRPKNVGSSNTKSRVQKSPVELITVAVEGLQVLKPVAEKGSTRDGVLERGLNQTVDTYTGVNLGADIVISEDDTDDGMPNWVVENMRFSVKQPIDAVVTKDELQYLIYLWRSEVDSMGRITAGVLRVLKLERSIGSQVLSQLNSLGSDGFEKIFSPKRLSRDSSPISVGLSATPSPTPSAVDGGGRSSLEATVASLEEVMMEAQTKCAAISAEVDTPGTSPQHLDHVKDLRQKLASMQKLLQRLRTQM